MILHDKRRSTMDIDFAIVESPGVTKANKVFRVTVQRAEISSNKSIVPFATEFKQAIEIVAQNHKSLPDDWMNDEAAVYYYDDAPYAEVTLWRSFEDIVYVYLPTMEYILATKIAAYRQRDKKDIQILLHDLNIHTREQAKAIVDRFLLPDAQEFWEVAQKLDVLFP